jgi:hypothetical protein
MVSYLCPAGSDHYFVSCLAGITGVYHHAWLIFEIGSHYRFCPSWPCTKILPPLGIIGTNQQTPAQEMLKKDLNFSYYSFYIS